MNKQLGNSKVSTRVSLVMVALLVEGADRRLAEAYSGLFRAFLEHDKSVKLVTFWGLNDALSWRSRGRPLLFDGNDQPKPAFDAVIRVVAAEQHNSRATNQPLP